MILYLYGREVINTCLSFIKRNFMSTTLAQIIGRNIKEIRTEQGIKCETLAKALRKTKGAISQLESGLVDFKVSQLTKIATALNTEVCLIVCEQVSQTAKKSKERSSSLRTISVDTQIIEHLLGEIRDIQKEIASLKK